MNASAIAEQAFNRYINEFFAASEERRERGRPSFAYQAGQLDLFNVNPRAAARAVKLRREWLQLELQAMRAVA